MKVQLGLFNMALYVWVLWILNVCCEIESIFVWVVLCMPHFSATSLFLIESIFT